MLLVAVISILVLEIVMRLHSLIVPLLVACGTPGPDGDGVSVDGKSTVNTYSYVFRDNGVYPLFEEVLEVPRQASVSAIEITARRADILYLEATCDSADGYDQCQALIGGAYELTEDWDLVPYADSEVSYYLGFDSREAIGPCCGSSWELQQSSFLADALVDWTVTDQAYGELDVVCDGGPNEVEQRNTHNASWTIEDPATLAMFEGSGVQDLYLGVFTAGAMGSSGCSGIGFQTGFRTPSSWNVTLVP